MPKALYLYHDTHFDLVDEDSLGDAESLGVYSVENAKSGDTEERHKIAVDAPSNRTEVLIPDGYEATPIALTHLVETLLDRHSPSDAITGVWSEDAALGKRVAALIGADYVEEPQA